MLRNLSFQNPLVYKCGAEPDSKARNEDDGKGKVPPEAEERNEIKEYARQNSPERPFGEALHHLGITLMLQIDPNQYQGPCKGHDADETCGRWEFLSDCRGGKDDDHAQDCFNQNLHAV